MNTLNKTILGAGAILIAISCGDQAEKPKEIETPKVSAFDLNNIDSSAVACDNFYQYAVGNWLKENPVPESESRWGSFNIVHEANKKKLKVIIEDAVKAKAEKGTDLQLVGDFYASALDSNTVNELGIKPLQPLLDKIDAATNVQEVVETMAEMRKNGSGSIFSYWVGVDSKNSNSHIFSLGQGGIGLPDRDYYFPTEERGKMILAEYEKHIAALFTLAKFEGAEDMAKNVVALETEFATASMTRVERRNPVATYNKMTIDELQELSTKIDWKSFLNAAEINGVEELVVRQPDYLKALDVIFENTPITTFKTYMKWHLINDFANNLSIEFEEQRFSFYATTLSGISQMKPRWERAISKANSYVGEPIGKLFVNKHFPEESKQKVLDLIDNIAEVFKERVETLEWMSDSTKLKALDKLANFTYKIGYPDEWEDYSSVDINNNTLLQNIFNMNYFGYKDQVERLGKPVDKKEWGMTPQTINAYYNPTMNEIVFPAAILQPPFFNPEADDALNYGGIGGVIGHEFSHGFDDQGSQYDGEGNLNNWWSDEDRANFEKRTGKLVDQFNKFHVADSVYVNGELTLGENIADLAGITLSYYALLKSYEGKELPADIDGFNYKQRFFLGWAQVWHGNATKEESIRLAKVDPHSPTKYRVLGPLTNLTEFDGLFGCEHGSMIAEDSLRVVIW